jgi:hypothetical protein
MQSKRHRRSHKWSAEQHAKFKATMSSKKATPVEADVVEAKPLNAIAVNPHQELAKQLDAFWSTLSLGSKLYALARFMFGDE